MRLKIFRTGPGVSDRRYDTFEVDSAPGMTVLSALYVVQEQFDMSLAFRSSCRGAVCGTCAMMINRIPRLACRTQLGHLTGQKEELHLHAFIPHEYSEPWDPASEIIIEPLPNLPVIKDLIVDMRPFFAAYRKIDPVFRPSGIDPLQERKMDPAAVRELEKYTTCVLCAACYGACPVNGKNPRYLGPAALAKLYRFYIDPREDHSNERLAAADSPEGWWACEFHTNCRKVCPKAVPPDKAIGNARKDLARMKESRSGVVKKNKDGPL